MAREVACVAAVHPIGGLTRRAGSTIRAESEAERRRYSDVCVQSPDDRRAGARLILPRTSDYGACGCVVDGLRRRASIAPSGRQ